MLISALIMSNRVSIRCFNFLKDEFLWQKGVSCSYFSNLWIKPFKETCLVEKKCKAIISTLAEIESKQKFKNIAINSQN